MSTSPPRPRWHKFYYELWHDRSWINRRIDEVKIISEDATETKSTFDLNIYATDAFYGWSEIVVALRCTWSTLLIHGISLFLVSLALPSFLGVWIAPLFVQWIVTLSLYTLLPLVVMISNKKRWQKEKLEELQCKSEQQGSQQTEWHAQQISEAAKLIREVSINPIKGFVPTMLVTSATLVTLWSVAKAIINLYS